MTTEKKNYRKTAIIVGVLFIIATAFLFIGGAFYGPVLDTPDYLEVAYPQRIRAVIGMLIDVKMPVPGAKPEAQKTKGGIDISELETVKRLSALMSTVIGARDKAVISAFEDLVVHLPAKGYGTVEFDMSDERRNLLVEAGREAMRAYFEKQEQPEFIASSAEEPLTPKTMADRRAERILLE